MNKTFLKKEKFFQILIIPLCLFVGFAFASLRCFNEVRYENIATDLPIIIIRLILYSSVLYLFLTFLKKTKLGDIARKIFTVFEEMPSEIDIYYIIYGVIVFYILYMMALKAPSDYPAHTSFAIDYLDWRSLKKSLFGSTFQLSYPMWHFTTSILNKVFLIPPVYAAAITSASFYTATYCIARKIIVASTKTTGIPLKYIDLFCASFMFLQPLYMPWFNPHQYLGQGSPNIWHNPTIVACYPFALICTFLFISMLEKYKQSERIEGIDYVRMGFYLFCSVIAKPIFFQYFIPAVGLLFIVMIIKTSCKSFFFSLKFILCCIPAAIWAAVALFISFYAAGIGQSGGMRIDFLYVWHLYTPNVLLSMFLACAFPIIYFITNIKNFRNKSLVFITFCTAIAWLESSLLAQNAYTAAGDFTWGYNASLTVLFCFTLADFLPKIFEEGASKIAVGFPLVVYVLHVMYGTLYYNTVA